MEKITENAYLTPDPLWKAFGIETFEQFIENYLVVGKFHKDVPEDVITQFKTIDYLLSHSFFHYPMLDIAFFKTTTVFEMAVRIRCNQLKIEFPNKNHVPLNSLLGKLAEVSHPSLPSEWHKVKYLRNHLAHPEQSQLLGITIINGISQVVNVLNKLFLPIEFFNDLDIRISQLRAKSEQFENGLFVLEYNNLKYLIYSAIPYLTYTKEGKEISFWCFYPVLKSFPQSLDKISTTPPKLLSITDLVFVQDRLSAKILHSQEQIEFYRTDQASHQDTYTKFRDQQFSAENGVAEIYLNLMDNEIAKGMVKFTYEQFWV